MMAEHFDKVNVKLPQVRKFLISPLFSAISLTLLYKFHFWHTDCGAALFVLLGRDFFLGLNQAARGRVSGIFEKLKTQGTTCISGLAFKSGDAERLGNNAGGILAALCRIFLTQEEKGQG